MKHLSSKLLAETVISRRKAIKMSQLTLSKSTGINRSIISRLESEDYTPSVDQLLALAEVLEFDYRDVFADDTAADVTPVERKKIAVAGTGYVGLSLAVYKQEVPSLSVGIAQSAENENPDFTPFS